VLLVDLKMASKNSNVGKLFDFRENGYGIVTHEARVDYRTWSPVIHILKFTDNAHKDKINLRFGYCDNTGKLIARPLTLTESELTELGKEAAKDPEIKKMLKGFCDQIR
jgi:hypothetical protein